MISMSPESRQRILNVMGLFRPTFRQVAQSLTDIDLILVEEGFERLLLDYDRIFTALRIPACLWRRTGEIYKGNREFAELINVPFDKLSNVSWLDLFLSFFWLLLGSIMYLWNHDWGIHSELLGGKRIASFFFSYTRISHFRGDVRNTEKLRLIQSKRQY